MDMGGGRADTFVALLLTGGSFSLWSCQRPRRCTKPRTPRSPTLLCAWLLPFLIGRVLLVPRWELNRACPLVAVSVEQHS